MVGKVGVDPTVPRETDLQSAAVADLLLPEMVLVVRVELTTNRVSDGHSTTELHQYIQNWSEGIESNYRLPLYKNGPITAWVPSDVTKVGRMRQVCSSPFVFSSAVLIIFGSLYSALAFAEFCDRTRHWGVLRSYSTSPDS